MHLQKLTDDIYGTPAAIAEWQEFAPLIGAAKSDKRLILVSGADWQIMDPERITKRYSHGMFLPPTKLGFYLSCLKDSLGLSSAFFRAADAEKAEKPETIQRYRMEDQARLAIATSGHTVRQAAFMLSGEMADSNIVYVNNNSDLVRIMLGIKESQFDRAALPGSETDWRFMYLAHEVTHTHLAYAHKRTVIAQYQEEMHADDGAGKIYETARALVAPEMHPDVPAVMNMARTIAAFRIPPKLLHEQRNFPATPPYTDGLKDEDTMVEVCEDFRGLSHMLHGATRMAGMQHFSGQYIASHMLEQTGLLTDRQVKMTHLFRSAVEYVLQTGIVRNGPSIHDTLVQTGAKARAEMQGVVVIRL